MRDISDQNAWTPRGITVNTTQSAQVITYRWYTPSAQLFFAILLLDGVMAYSIYLLAVTFPHAQYVSAAYYLRQQIMLLLFLALFIYFSYFMLARLVNNTELQLTPERISVRHYPLYWPGNRRIPVTKINGFFCEKRFFAGRYGRGYTYYYVVASLQNGRHIDLVSQLKQEEQGQFIIDQIGKQVGFTWGRDE